jgi:parallel beta-helix repeat protein
MRFITALCLALILMGLAAAPTAAAPTTYYLAPNGNDNNPGTEAQPWRNLWTAAGKMKPGDTVLVKNGNYKHFEIRTSGQPDAWITYRAYPGHNPRINGVDVAQGILVKGVSYIEISGFNLQGSSGNQFWIGSGINIEQSHHIRVVNNTVGHWGGGGISARESDHITIENNIVHDNAKTARFGNSGISLFEMQNRGGAATGFNNVIRGNTAYRNENRYAPYYSGDNPYDSSKIDDGNCIIIDRGNDRSYTGSTLIENNVCFDNGGRGIHTYRSSNVMVRHNTLFQNQRTDSINDGELTAIESQNIQFFNNLAYTRPGARATNTWASSNITYSHNLFYNTNRIPDKSGTDITGQDPLLLNASIDPGQANFRVLANSPIINAANAAQGVSHDISGRGRPYGGGYDIGAYEYTGDSYQLLGNGNFDLAGNNQRSAAGWRGKNLTNDRRVCDNAKRTVSRSAPCVFQFGGSRTVTSRIVMRLNGSPIHAGDSLNLNAWVESNNLNSAAKMRIVVRYQDGTRDRQVVNIEGGSSSFREYSTSVNVSKPVKLVNIQFVVPPGRGRMRIDDVSLNLNQSSAASEASLLPLPAPQN